MLDTQLTLSVDPTGANASKVNETLNRFDKDGNKSIYRFSDFTIAARNQMEVYRNTISPSGNYLGNAKGMIKLTEDQAVVAKDGTDIVAPTIGTIQLSLPVGVTDEMFYHIIGRMQALLLDSSLMHKIFMQQDI